MRAYFGLTAGVVMSCRVRIVINADGRPSGMAFVEFASPADAATAMAKASAAHAGLGGPLVAADRAVQGLPMQRWSSHGMCGGIRAFSTHPLQLTVCMRLQQDRKMLGNRYVELFPSSREEATMDRGGRR